MLYKLVILYVYKANHNKSTAGLNDKNTGRECAMAAPLMLQTVTTFH